MNWISSFIDHAVAAPNSGYAASQTKQNGDVSGAWAKLLEQYLPAYSSELQNLVNQEPGRQQAIANAQLQLSPGNNASNLQQFTNNAYSNANRANQQSSDQLQHMGYSPAYTAGATTAGNNAAATESNNYGAYLNSPEYQLQQSNARLGLYSQAQSNPLAQPIQQATGDVFGAPTVQVGASPLAGIAGIVGDAIPGLGSLFGGGSSGGSGYATDPYGQAYAPGVSTDSGNAFGGVGFS